jgi:hypothetical protein
MMEHLVDPHTIKQADKMIAELRRQKAVLHPE